MSTVLPVALVAAAALAGALYWRARRHRPREAVVFHHFRCRCGQKLRYRADRVGRGGMCPRCGRISPYPAAALRDAGEAPGGYRVERRASA